MSDATASSHEFTLAEVQQELARAFPDRECIVTRGRRLTWAHVDERGTRLAEFFASCGLGAHVERSDLENWQSGQDLVGLYLPNCSAYLEAMAAAHKCRVAPFNVNYRYTEHELMQVLRPLRPRGLVFHASLAGRVAKVINELPSITTLLQVDDGSSAPLLAGATPYERAVEEGGETALPSPSPDDLYVLMTGGTTGTPKAVLWRQADIFVAAMNGARPDGGEFGSLAELVARAEERRSRTLAVAPFMHGGGLWSALSTLHEGGCVVIPKSPSLDAEEVWSTVERERISGMLIIGDAFAKPLVEALERGRYDISSLSAILTGGAGLSARWKQRLLALVPGAAIVDIMGSSETGSQATEVTRHGDSTLTGRYRPRPSATVLNAARTAPFHTGDEEPGWLATSGRVPLGYLNDPDKTASTFPVLGGRRFAIAGDRARLREDGTVEVLGRDASVINTGGEKVFAEEVEAVLKSHSAVADAIVVGRPDSRWGQVVAAVVELERDHEATVTEDVTASARSTLASYKVPRDLVVVDAVRRLANGKADYAWARSVIEQALSARPVEPISEGEQC